MALWQPRPSVDYLGVCFGPLSVQVYSNLKKVYFKTVSISLLVVSSHGIDTLDVHNIVHSQQCTLAV